MTAPTPADAPQKAKPLWLRLLPLLVLAAALIAVLVSGVWRDLNLETLQENQAALESYVAANLFLAVLIYTIVYALAVSISVPGAIWFTIGAGFLFGPIVGTGVAVTGSTIGATIIFIAVRYAFADWARARFGTWVKRLQDGFSSDAFSYVLILRLIPVLPFFGINIATALLNVPLRAYVLGTLIGVMPLAYVYATVGSTISRAAGGVPGLLDLLTPELIAAIAVFALVGFLP
ncbi:MAG: TVP38/TMEM64 family protein, partial [Caulobacterales bacterium]|uniref:TVP38/TMEM64 family protein n=1 Tax=Glycocaulis sp. TaxID=1969725 RepID=UPI003F9FF600